MSRPVWRWWEPVLGLFALYAFAILLDLANPGLVVGQFLFDAAILAIPLCIAVVWHRFDPAAFGLRRSSFTPGRTVLWILAGLTVCGMLIGIYVSAFGVPGRTWITREHPRGASATALALCAVTLVPVAEELFWRGFVHRSLRRYMPLWPALLISSTLFGLSHWVGGDAFSTVVPRVVIGGLLALLLERTGSLYPGMVAHAYLNMGVLWLWAPSVADVVWWLWLLAAVVAIAVSVKDPRRKKLRRADSVAPARGPAPA